MLHRLSPRLFPATALHEHSRAFHGGFWQSGQFFLPSVRRLQLDSPGVAACLQSVPPGGVNGFRPIERKNISSIARHARSTIDNHIDT